MSLGEGYVEALCLLGGVCVCIGGVGRGCLRVLDLAVGVV